MNELTQEQLQKLIEFVEDCSVYKGDGSACLVTYREIVADLGEQARELLREIR